MFGLIKILIIDIVKAEMEKLNAERKVETPPIKRGLELNPYVQMAAGQIVEYDFQKVRFETGISFSKSCLGTFS